MEGEWTRPFFEYLWEWRARHRDRARTVLLKTALWDVSPQLEAYVIQNLWKFSRTLSGIAALEAKFMERHRLPAPASEERALKISSEQVCITSDNVHGNSGRRISRSPFSGIV